jgi:mono/diheme cytochrome c family protein
MKSRIRINPILIFGMLFLIIGLNNAYSQDKPKGKPWPPTEAAVKLKNPVAATDENLAEGKSLYAKHCKSCHGVKGKGDGTKAESIDISCGDFTSEDFQKETDGTIYWKTTEGRDPMPTFKKKVSDDERWKMVVYIRTLKK